MFSWKDSEVDSKECARKPRSVLDSSVLTSALYIPDCFFLHSTAAVVRASAILRSQRGRKQPPARKVRGSGARKVVKIEEPTA